VMRTVPSEPCTVAADSRKRSIMRLWYEESDEVSSHSDAGGWCALNLASPTGIQHMALTELLGLPNSVFEVLCILMMLAPPVGILTQL
jgi:hypothetical protein